MKTFALSLFAVAALSSSAVAQQVDLPRPSPFAKVWQTVGLTEITVDYSSPAVRGRKIWGGLVPYGEVWRAGANAATKLTFSKDVTVGGTAIPAGSYALFMIPTADKWTIIINKDFNAPGAFNYKKELDVVRFDVKPDALPMNHERLAYVFNDFTNDEATLSLVWEKVRVPMSIKLATQAQVTANLKALEENAWQPFNAAARYELEQTKNYDAGLKYVDQSLRVREDWLNVWTKAQLLAAKGKYGEAYPLAQKAQTLGQKAQRFFFADEVKKALVEWKGKK